MSDQQVASTLIQKLRQYVAIKDSNKSDQSDATELLEQRHADFMSIAESAINNKSVQRDWTYICFKYFDNDKCSLFYYAMCIKTLTKYDQVKQRAKQYDFAKDSFTICSLLLQTGANANNILYSGTKDYISGSCLYYTPLLYAIDYNWYEMIELLLTKYNVNPNLSFKRESFNDKKYGMIDEYPLHYLLRTGGSDRLKILGLMLKDNDFDNYDSTTNYYYNYVTDGNNNSNKKSKTKKFTSLLSGNSNNKKNKNNKNNNDNEEKYYEYNKETEFDWNSMINVECNNGSSKLTIIDSLVKDDFVYLKNMYIVEYLFYIQEKRNYKVKIDIANYKTLQMNSMFREYLMNKKNSSKLEFYGKNMRSKIKNMVDTIEFHRTYLTLGALNSKLADFKTLIHKNYKSKNKIKIDLDFIINHYLLIVDRELNILQKVLFYLIDASSMEIFEFLFPKAVW